MLGGIVKRSLAMACPFAIAKAFGLAAATLLPLPLYLYSGLCDCPVGIRGRISVAPQEERPRSSLSGVSSAGIPGDRTCSQWASADGRPTKSTRLATIFRPHPRDRRGMAPHDERIANHTPGEVVPNTCYERPP